jgi:hypothetical protein
VAADSMPGSQAARRGESPRQASPQERLRRLKTWAVATSVGAFAAFMGMAFAHVTGVTARTHAAGGAGAGPSLHAAENAFFGGSGPSGQQSFGSGGGPGGGAGAPAAATTVS